MSGGDLRLFPLAVRLFEAKNILPQRTHVTAEAAAPARQFTH